MSHKKINHTNETHGSVHVLGRHPLNSRHWAVRWGCCGREQEISAERLGVIIRTAPKRCITCVREEKKDTPGAIRDRERRTEHKTAKKAVENRPEEVRPLVIKDLNGNLWPELGKLGPRR